MRGRSVLFVASCLVVAAACVPDLPEPLQCPSAVRTTTCESEGSRPLGGCALDQPGVVACLEEQGRTCACAEGEGCPSERAACYPEGDCPPFARRELGDGIRCLRGEDARVSGDCACGCAACALVCDGVGLVLGGNAPTPGSRIESVLTVSLAGLPASGSLRAYVLWRGSGSASVTPRSASGGGPRLLPEAPASRETFSERLFFADQGGLTSLPGVATTWTDAASAPVAIEIALLPTTGGTIEIDCVMPIVLP